MHEQNFKLMKNYYFNFLLFILLVNALSGFSQTAADQPVKVAVFIPIYADSAFEGSALNTGKNNLPKNIMPGLEFYNGVMMAIDSLNEEGTFAEIQIYDSKSFNPLVSVLSDTNMSKVGLIIAAITNSAELKTFSDYALAQNIPLISATYPNYVGLKENPFVVLLNSSFEAHIQGLHKYMQKNYSSDTIIAVTRKGGQYEAFIKSYVSSINANHSTTPLKLRWVTMDEKNVNIEELHLDTAKTNIVFVASPMEKFGLDIVKTLSSNDQYRTTAIGMPTWDNIKQLDHSSCRNVEILYSTPFVFSKNKSLNSSISNTYKGKFYSRPSDMVFKGYESVYHFTKLLVKHRADIVNNLSDKDFTVFNEFKLEPVKVFKSSIRPDFIENKKLYFIKKKQGNVRSVI